MPCYWWFLVRWLFGPVACYLSVGTVKKCHVVRKIYSLPVAPKEGSAMVVGGERLELVMFRPRRGDFKSKDRVRLLRESTRAGRASRKVDTCTLCCETKKEKRKKEEEREEKVYSEDDVN